jgi:DNA-binding XRE family transcriptional regulator
MAIHFTFSPNNRQEQNYTIVNVNLCHCLLVLSVSFVPKNRRILGDAVRTQRKRLKMTQEKLAEKTGLSVIFLSLLENGHRTVSVDALLRIAKALGVRATDLMNGL